MKNEIIKYIVRDLIISLSIKSTCNYPKSIHRIGHMFEFPLGVQLDVSPNISNQNIYLERKNTENNHVWCYIPDLNFNY